MLICRRCPVVQCVIHQCYTLAKRKRLGSVSDTTQLAVDVSCGCAVSRSYINVFNCDRFSVVNAYLDHLKLCVVCINGRRCLL